MSERESISRPTYSASGQCHAGRIWSFLGKLNAFRIQRNPMAFHGTQIFSVPLEDAHFFSEYSVNVFRSRLNFLTGFCISWPTGITREICHVRLTAISCRTTFLIWNCSRDSQLRSVENLMPSKGNKKSCRRQMKQQIPWPLRPRV